MSTMNTTPRMAFGNIGNMAREQVRAEELVTYPGQKSQLAIEIREGDWLAYFYHTKGQIDVRGIVASYGSVTAYKQECALAYLGRRAQHRGGVCSGKERPSIFTHQFISELASANRSQRYLRYPWLETLINLLAEIEKTQVEIHGGNVISLVPTIK